MTTGQTFRNGLTGLRAHSVSAGELLTVVRRDRGAYGCSRYLVRDSRGRHTYAFGPEGE